MIKFLNSIIDLIYRKKCYFCGKSKQSVKMCSDCYNELYFADIQVQRIISGINVYSCGVYDKYLQKLIRGIKYHNQKELAYYLAKFMYEYFEQTGIEKQFQVVPVPMHKSRKRKRKYNQTELIAEEFCKLTGFTFNNELIERIKDTKPQYKLSRPERIKNLSGAFKVNKEKLLDMPILIIDDICSTGSTFEEMIKTLKSENISDIVCLAASSPV
jgi:ComF family protein